MDAKAQYVLGRKYEIGDGVSMNYDESLKWYRLSAAQGNAKAQYKVELVLGFKRLAVKLAEWDRDHPNEYLP